MRIEVYWKVLNSHRQSSWYRKSRSVVLPALGLQPSTWYLILSKAWMFDFVQLFPGLSSASCICVFCFDVRSKDRYRIIWYQNILNMMYDMLRFNIIWYSYWLQRVFFSESQNIPLQRAVAGLNMCLNGSCNFMSWFRRGIMKDMISTSRVRALVTVSICRHFCVVR